jgi:hypothetical protein
MGAPATGAVATGAPVLASERVSYAGVTRLGSGGVS